MPELQAVIAAMYHTYYNSLDSYAVSCPLLRARVLAVHCFEWNIVTRARIDALA
jgi:hypothetical protein